MFVLLAAATSLEIRALTAWLEENHLHPGDRAFRVGDHDFRVVNRAFRVGDHDVAILITGVGALSTGYSLMQSLHQRRPDLVIQGGIAGCFPGDPGAAREIPLPPIYAGEPHSAGPVVAIREEISADLGVWENGAFRSLFDLGLADPGADPFSNGLLVNPYPQLLAFTRLETVRAVSAGEISTDPRRIAWLQQNIRPVVESMEGAALHYVCLREDVPFLQIRSVSNEVGVRDKSKWFMAKALDDLNACLIDLLKRLPAAGRDLFDRGLASGRGS